MRKLFLTIFVIGLAAAAHALATPEALLFKDLSLKDPAYPYVLKMVTSYEALSGYPDKTFRGRKTVSRMELAKILSQGFAYLEKRSPISLGEENPSTEVYFKDLPRGHWAYPFVVSLVNRYKVTAGYPDKSFRPKQTITRFELASLLSKAMKRIYAGCGYALPSVEAVKLKDVKPDHWAMKDIALLLSLNIMQSKKNKNNQTIFAGDAQVDRFGVATSVARLIDRGNALVNKIGPKKAEQKAPAIIQREVAVASSPGASISGGFGNLYEGASGTNNWRNFSAAATYGNSFKIFRLSGNYELTAKYSNDQVVYLVPAAGGGTDTSLNIENRTDLELNTTYQLVQFLGITGKLLLGVKYANLNNPTAPTNFTGLNAGLVTAINFWRRNILLKAFYSLPLSRAQVSPSVLGQPAQLFDYEASIDAELFRLPLLVGFAGETMTFTGSGQRLYNNIFIRYSLF